VKCKQASEEESGSSLGSNDEEEGGSSFPSAVTSSVAWSTAPSATSSGP
jgi:hypothetical protein